MDTIPRKKFMVYSKKNLSSLPQINRIPRQYHDDIKAVSEVIPFRVNNYVLDELINWDNIPHDPIFQLTFPQAGMLAPEDLALIKDLNTRKSSESQLKKEVVRIHQAMNPHPAGQLEKNVPSVEGMEFTGLQHKYNETVLFFPTQGQTCHSYCTYCFRWVQFVGMEKLMFASSKPGNLTSYLRLHPEVTDVLFTGGDPLVMRAQTLRHYIEPIILQKPGNVSTIRIGTKSPAYWPYRFLTDADAGELLALFEEIVAAGFHLAIMVHFSHPRELETPAARQALKKIIATGAVVRCQAPIVRHVNDDPQIWIRLWQNIVNNGAFPYYMFVPRDTGAKAYFEMPLAEACRIYSEAYSRVSGLCRTVRGPSMSADPGKVHVVGVSDIRGEKVFVMKFIQARNPEWVNLPFYAAFDETAAWLDELKPAFGDEKFFFEQD
ncbi:MAG: lysine 2,3-aminomutase [Pseudomonadota bacterium]